LRLACCVAAAVLSLDVAWGRTAASPAEDPSAESNSALTRRLWESRIATPDPSEDTDERQNLRNLIEKVRSLKFEGNQVTPSFSSPTDVPPRAGYSRSNDVVATTPSATAPSALTTTSTVESAGPSRPAPLEDLGGRLHDTDYVRNPLEVAELLFLSGRPVEAIGFYEKALARTARADAATSEDRAWILFQLGNCLRETDMTRARDAYIKLVAEHPTSPWTELAKAHGRLITWYLAAKPDQLMSPGPSQ
jgi:tetratricopeptide (TPR) repeat protein